MTSKSHWTRETWCFRTKKQGFAGVRHHVHDVEVPFDLRDVKLPGERIRVCGERHHVRYAAKRLLNRDVVLVDERTRVCGGEAPRPKRRLRSPESDVGDPYVVLP